MLDTIAVVVIVATAAGYLVYRQVSGKKSGCCGCGSSCGSSVTDLSKKADTASHSCCSGKDCSGKSGSGGHSCCGN